MNTLQNNLPRLASILDINTLSTANANRYLVGLWLVLLLSAQLVKNPQLGAEGHRDGSLKHGYQLLSCSIQRRIQIIIIIFSHNNHELEWLNSNDLNFHRDCYGPQVS